MQLYLSFTSQLLFIQLVEVQSKGSVYFKDALKCCDPICSVAFLLLLNIYEIHCGINCDLPKTHFLQQSLFGRNFPGVLSGRRDSHLRVTTSVFLGFLFPTEVLSNLSLTLIHGSKGVITALVKTCESSSQ